MSADRSNLKVDLTQPATFATFLEKLRNAKLNEIISLFPDIEKILLEISQHNCSTREKNELIRQVAFTLFNRPEVNRYHRRSPLLHTLRVLIFHHFERTDITAKFLMKGCHDIFPAYKPYKPSILEPFRLLYHGVRPMKESYKPAPISSHLSEKITSVYSGTGKDFFELLSQGKVKGYLLDDATSLGIYVSPIDKKMSEAERIYRTKGYALDRALHHFDYPIYIEMNVPTEHLSHVWMRNCNHANKGYEAVIIEKDLNQIRKNKSVGTTVYQYPKFDCGEQFHEWNIREPVTKEALGITEIDYLLTKEFVINNHFKAIKLEDTINIVSRHFIFGESIEENQKDKKELSQNADDFHSAFRPLLK